MNAREKWLRSLNPQLSAIWVPKGRPIDAHLDNPDYVGGVWAVVDFDVTPYLGKSVRFNATLPEHLLQRIDDYVKNHPEQKSRSGFLASAALRVLSGI